MNVLIINSGSDLYGANRILLQTIEMLKPRKVILVIGKQGLLTDYISTNANYTHVHIIELKTLPVVFRKMNFKNGLHLIKNIILFKRSIKKIKHEFSINWVYVNTLSNFIVIFILKKLHLKILVHVHEILENHKLFTRSINRYSIKWADKIIAVSKPVELNLKQAYKKNNIVIVLNGISDMYLPDIKKNQSAITVTFFGRIKPEKGVWFFLDAIASLDKSALSKVNFLIIGSAAPGGDHFIKKLKNDIAMHSAKNIIQFRPFVNDIKSILNNSDIIVVPSLMKDPFPTTILESASAGKPVIATNNGGAIQSVKNNVTGFLITPSDSNEFARCLEKLLKSEQLRSKMGEEARKFYLENFTLDIFKNNFLTVIKDFENTITYN